MANMMILKVNIIGKKAENPMNLYEFKLQFLKVFEENFCDSTVGHQVIGHQL